MPDIQLTETERKVLSYTARGVSREQAVDKISAFLQLPANEVLGAINSLRKQNLIVESKSGTATLSVLTNNPLKVKPSMLDSSITSSLNTKEHGTKAGALKMKTVVNERTGEVHEVDPSAKPKKKGPDFGFDLN